MKPLLVLRTWATRIVCLYALWLLLVGYADDPLELACGGAAVVLGLAGLEAARRQEREQRVPVRVALRGLWRLPWELLRDSLVVLAAIPLRRRGRFRSTTLASGDDAFGSGLRAWSEVRGTVAPNAIVVDVDPEQDFALLHELDPRFPGTTA